MNHKWHGNPRYTELCPWIKKNASAMRLLVKVGRRKETKSV